MVLCTSRSIFFFDQKNSCTTCDINSSFYLKCIESLLVCSSPSTYHQRQWLSSPISLDQGKKESFSVIFVSNIFLLNIYYFLSRERSMKKRDHSLELNTVFTSENLLVQLGEKDSRQNIQKDNLL